MAAVAQVRLRAFHGVDVLEHADRLGRGARRVVPRRLAAAQHQRLGPAPCEGGRRLPRVRKRGINLRHGQPRRRLPTKYLRTCRPGSRTLGDLPRAARHFGNRIRRPSSSRAAASSATPGDRGRGRARLQEARTTTCAGSISTSASSAVSPRTMDRVDPYPIGPRRDGGEIGHACSPARLPDFSRCCCTSGGEPMTDDDKVLMEGRRRARRAYPHITFKQLRKPDLSHLNQVAGPCSQRGPRFRGQTAAAAGTEEDGSSSTFTERSMRRRRARSLLLDAGLGRPTFSPGFAERAAAEGVSPRAGLLACHRRFMNEIVGTVPSYWTCHRRAAQPALLPRAAHGSFPDHRSPRASVSSALDVRAIARAHLAGPMA